MDYSFLMRAWKHRDQIFEDHNGADGTGSDTSTDPIITRDPNSFVLPRVNSFSIAHGLLIAVGILAVIILAPIAFKTLKNVAN